jgi:hypothetical protein
MKNYRLLYFIIVSVVLAGSFYLYSYMKKENLNKLRNTISLNEKRIDFLLKNHNCKKANINLLEIELNHFVVRKSKLQQLTTHAQDFIDVPATIDGIKKDCELKN